MRLLLVEDSLRLQRSVSAALRREGYAVDVAGDGEEGLWLASSNEYDALILDIMLPKMDGLTLLRQLRGKGRSTHVLLLTARDTVADRVTGLRTGADDYLVKPFALEELLARVEALCRRSYGSKQPLVQLGDLSLDTAAKQLRRGEAFVELSAREYALLEYLFRRSGEVVSRSDIESHLYDEQVDPMSNVVDSAICLLRRKIGAGYIKTLRGQGYCLVDPRLAEESPGGEEGA